MALVKYNNNSLSAITSTGLTAGAMTLIKEQTASSSSTISFVHGTSDVVLDSTYPIYIVKYINVHAAADSKHLEVNFRDGGSSYDATNTGVTLDTSSQKLGSGAYDYDSNSGHSDTSTASDWTFLHDSTAKWSFNTWYQKPTNFGHTNDLSWILAMLC